MGAASVGRHTKVQAAAVLEFRVLGSLEVWRHGERLSLGAAKQRAVLAILLLNVDRIVTTDRLIDALWPKKPPGRPQTAIQGYVSQLRKLLEPASERARFELLVSEAGGYRLCLQPEQLDLNRFESRLREAQQALLDGDARSADAVFEEALSLFRGPPLADFSYELWAQDEISRVEELRLAALEGRIDARLALGEDDGLVADLERLTRAHPLRERLRAQLMLALYRSGRQAEALQAYRETRVLLRDDLGIEPSPDLQALYKQILNHDHVLVVERPVHGRPAGLPASNLPTPASSFLGRESELDEAAELLPEARLVTIVGPGGQGKTRFAVELASRQLEHFPNGVFWVPLASLRDASLVPEQVAQVLGAKDSLAAHIADRRMLLLLDNFEQVVDAAPRLSELLRSCRNLSLLVTSREALRIEGEREYLLPPLVEAEGVELFCARAPMEPNKVIGELCRRLDGLPLAIELAAARAKLLSPEQLLERLSMRLDLLKGGRDAEARHATLRATIEWSFDLLLPEEERLFARLAVFAGGCTLETAEEVVEAELETLQALIDKSLIRRTGGRYWMLETIREFAAERLGGSGEAEELRSRHLEHFLALAEQAEPRLITREQGTWNARLEAEQPNLRLALEWAKESDAPTRELRLCAALGRFWYQHSAVEEGRRWLDDALARAGEEQTAVRARALQQAGTLAFVGGDFEAGRKYKEGSLAAWRVLSDTRGIYECLCDLATAAVIVGDRGAADALLAESETLESQIEDEWLLANAKNNASALAFDDRLFVRALELGKGAVTYARRAGLDDILSLSLVSSGWAAIYADEEAQATAFLREALALGTTLGRAECVAQALEGIGVVLARRADASAAAALVGAVESTLETAGLAPQPSEIALLDEARRLSLAELGEERLRDALQEGRTMTLETAATFAVESLDASQHRPRVTAS